MRLTTENLKVGMKIIYDGTIDVINETEIITSKATQESYVRLVTHELGTKKEHIIYKELGRIFEVLE